MLFVRQATKTGWIGIDRGGVADLSYPSSNTRRGRVTANGQICPTLTAQDQEVYRIMSTYRIRKLTPCECWRLMGWNDEGDECFHRAESVNSNTQLYKQAGNSIVVPVLERIFSQMFV